MKRKMLSMLAMSAILIAGENAIAGEAGMVTIPPVIEVNAVGTGTASDGTGGYKPSHGLGTGYLNKAVTVSGNNFTYSASGSPSRTVNDSAVTITYKGPSAGEEEKSSTAKCTVVRLALENFVAMTWVLPNVDSAVVCGVDGKAEPDIGVPVLLIFYPQNPDNFYPKRKGVIKHPVNFNVSQPEARFRYEYTPTDPSPAGKIMNLSVIYSVCKQELSTTIIQKSQ